jgi:hypothetical protein
LRPVADELYTLGGHLEAAHLTAALAVVPLVEAQTAFHKNGRAAVQVVSASFRLLSPDIDINKAGIFALLAGRCGVFPTGGHAHITDPRTAVSIPEIRIAGEVTDKIDFVETGHERGLLSDGLCF